ncbi:hypothetical protein U9M48_014934 [Paspalum notatum var. saurae]|uniref:Uncharacterized protein n=1 Tax=Paspalum notatum var. saurae TaxID=547442 RepID=A0AAQ3T3N4_PASNO
MLSMMVELPAPISLGSHASCQCVHAPPNKNLKATTKALRRGAMRSIFIYSPLKPLKHFISKSLSSAESSLEQAAYTTLHSNMCSGSWSSSSKKHPSLVVVNLKRQQQKTKTHVSVAIRRKRLKLWRLRAGAEALEMVNLKLYLENRCIIAENERLRERASALRRENLALRQNLSKTAAAQAGQAELPTAGVGAA